jgi:hypothetical protein
MSAEGLVRKSCRGVNFGLPRLSQASCDHPMLLEIKTQAAL